jgi:hypothetical protein
MGVIVGETSGHTDAVPNRGSGNEPEISFEAAHGQRQEDACNNDFNRE